MAEGAAFWRENDNLLKLFINDAKSRKYSACFQFFKNSSGHDAKNLIKEEA